MYGCYSSAIQLLLSILLCAGFSSAHATKILPPTLSELVAGSEHIGLATIRRAEDYYVTDEHGEFWCGVLYQATWVDSFTGDSGSFEFTSYEALKVRGLYLLYLATNRLPRTLLSTNSVSEAQRASRLKRERQCQRTVHLPRTLFKAAEFFDETYLADVYKTGTWLELPNFSQNTLTEIVVMPTEISIDGQVMSRERFIHEFYDEYKHGFIRAAGYQLIIFRAVDWAEYCSAIVDLVNEKPSTTSENRPAKISNCQFEPPERKTSR